MHGRPTLESDIEAQASHPQRWRILGVLVLALVVTSVDHTIINVAMPRLVGDLGATAAQLQWVVAAYTVVFAGMLLTAGSMGDRFGRRHALIAGLATFLAGSVAAATSSSTTSLIVSRGVMGLGGALIMPTTLSILVSVFGSPRERAKAIAIWTAASGAGIALGPIVGGALMRSFSWSSVFWINVPLLAVALVRAAHLVPDSRDPHATRLDPVGAVLSIIGIGSLVYAIIQAPESGWTSTASLCWFVLGVAMAVAFVEWELHRTDPMLDKRLFTDRSFSAGSTAIALLFFARSVPAYRGGCDLMRHPEGDGERLDVFPAFDQVSRLSTLDDLPLAVITAAHRSPDGITPEEQARLDRLWAAGQERWAARSSSSRVVTVDDTGHDIHLDQPQQVLAEVLRLLP